MLKRPVVCSGIVFVLSILAAFNDVNFLILVSISVAIATAALFYNPKKLLLILICTIVAVCGFVNTHYQMERVKNLSSALAGKDIKADLVATDFSSNGKVIATLKSGRGNISVYLSSSGLGEISPGDVIRANVTLCSADVNGRDFARYLYGRNVFVRAYADSVEVAGTDFSGIMGKVYKIRRYIRSSAEKVLSGDILALYEAMVIGDSSLMTNELKEKLRIAGLSHISVVSGMHLSIMLMVIMFVLRKIIGKSRITALVSIAVAIFITLVCGCGSSVVRACIMCIIFQIAQLLYRENDALSSLFVSVIVMSAYNPYVVYNTGFILSVLATMGIIIFSKRVGVYLGKFMPKHLSDIITMCLCAQMTVMPYIMYSFESFTSYGLIANVLVSIFADILVVAGLLLPILSAIPIVSVLAGWCVTGASYIIIAVCEAVQKLPKSVVEVKRPDFLMVAVWVFVLCAVKMYPQKKKSLFKIGAVLLIASLVSFSVSTMERNNAQICFIENDRRSSSAIFSEKGSVLIGCSDYYEAISLAEEKSDGVFDYLCVNEKNSEESQSLIRAGGVKNVIVCHATGGQGIEKIIECADEYGVFVIKLDSDEEYRVFEDTYISFMSFDSEYQDCGAVRLDYGNESYVSLEGMEAEESKKFCAGIYCSAMRFPRLLREVTEELKDDVYGRIITDKNKIFIKGKE